MIKDYLFSKLTNLTCGSKLFGQQRVRVVPLAAGRVLEIGAGSGLNFPYYDPERVEHLIALEPSPGMLELARARTAEVGVEVKLVQAGAEAIPLEDHAVDSILITFAMCSIPDLPAALDEMRRVLKPGGSLLFCEHGLAPEPSVRWWQHRLNPAWSRLSAGCNLNRDIPKLIEAGGFALQQMDSAYITRLKPFSFVFRGVAQAR